MKEKQGKGPQDLSRKQPGKGPQLGTLVLLKQIASERTRGRVQKKRKKLWKKKKKKRRRRKKRSAEEWLGGKKVQRKDRRSLYVEDERGTERKGRQKERQTSQSETSLGKSGRWVFFFMLMAQNWLCANATSGNAREREQMGRGDFTNVETAKR